MADNHVLQYTGEKLNEILHNAEYAVRHDAQELTDEQQAQARSNIGAADAETVSQLSEDKLDADKLDEAIDTALTQAKESGEFDGADGKDGQDGKDGYTPVKGTDYWTVEDRAAIVSDVLDALPAAEEASF